MVNMPSTVGEVILGTEMVKIPGLLRTVPQFFPLLHSKEGLSGELGLRERLETFFLSA
jgi:hypothetical protein